jgi:hypothetical protein
MVWIASMLFLAAHVRRGPKFHPYRVRRMRVALPCVESTHDGEKKHWPRHYAALGRPPDGWGGLEGIHPLSLAITYRPVVLEALWP